MEKKLKIAFLSFYSGEVYRGVETFVHELSNRLVDLGIDVTVYQNGPRLKNSKYKTVSVGMKVDWNIVSGEVNPKFIPFMDYWGFVIKKFTSRVLKIIDKDTDIVVPTNGGWQTLLCKIWTARQGKKMVVTGQSGPGRDDAWMIWCFPSRFIGLSEYHTNWAKKMNPFVKSATIHNGTDLERFNEKVKQTNINLERPVVLNVGALIPNKRQDLIIKAVSKLPSVNLLLVGKGERQKELQELGDSLMPGRLKIMSFSYEEMPKVYASADLFTYPTSPAESFGIAMIEAMASGLPVVANDDPIRREIVGDAGFFVNPSNIDEYAKAIDKAIDKKWGNIPRKQAEKFSWNDIAKKYEELLLNIAAKK